MVSPYAVCEVSLQSALQVPGGGRSESRGGKKSSEVICKALGITAGMAYEGALGWQEGLDSEAVQGLAVAEGPVDPETQNRVTVIRNLTSDAIVIPKGTALVTERAATEEEPVLASALDDLGEEP